jgi:hypothetical protein
MERVEEMIEKFFNDQQLKIDNPSELTKRKRQPLRK